MQIERIEIWVRCDHPGCGYVAGPFPIEDLEIAQLMRVIHETCRMDRKNVHRTFFVDFRAVLRHAQWERV